MSGKLTHNVVNLKSLDLEQRRSIVVEICALICKISVVKDYDRLYNNYSNPTSDVVKVKVFRDEDGKMVGFIKYTIDFGEYKGRKFAGFNSHAGFLRAYRGSSTTVMEGMKAMASFKLRHLNWDVYYFGALLHPSSYSLFAKYAVDYWPRYDKPTPPDQLQRMLELAEPQSGKENVYNKLYPLSRLHFQGTHTLPQEEEYWRNSEKPAVQYFLEINPRYPEGAGVFTWMTLDLKFFRLALTRFINESFGKKVKELKAAIYRSSIGKKILPKPDVLNIIRNISFFEHISEEGLRMISKAATVVSLRSGKYIIKAGDIGDSMYVLVQGSAYVLIHNEEGEIIVDQFSPGDYFGEMSLMSGEPRTASVRSISSTVLIRIDRRPFLEFLEENPENKSKAWDVFGLRRFNKYLMGQDRFAHLDYKARENWYKNADKKQLKKGTEITVPSSKYAFVITGSVEIKQGENWLSMKAPALLKFSEDWSLKASSESRVSFLLNTKSQHTDGILN